MNIKGLTHEELEDYFKSLGLPRFRAVQVYRWLYQKQACSWEQMTDLPQPLRNSLLLQEISLGCLELLTCSRDPDGTCKYLFKLTDNYNIESVFLPETERQTVCFSTQVGCAMGCLFCATGQNGLIRNLTAAEIVDQPLRVTKLTGKRLTNLVAMGQGEPLANFEALAKALKIINDSRGIGIGARHITISTCGLIPGIFKLAQLGMQVNLAISLHAANEQLRDYLMPINRRYPLKELIPACQDYLKQTGRRITFEYVLIDGVNDRAVDLQQLVNLIKGLLCHVNLIPFNPIPGSAYKASPLNRVKEFAKILNDAGVNTTVRKERGSDFAAACGQLQGKWLE